MSAQVERKLFAILGNPTESPYGNPIPGLEELGGVAAPAFMTNVESLVSLVGRADAPVQATIRRLGEPVQFDPELLGQLKQSGVLPGAVGTFSAAASYISVQVDGFGNGLELPVEVASHIFVATDS